MTGKELLAALKKFNQKLNETYALAEAELAVIEAEAQIESERDE